MNFARNETYVPHRRMAWMRSPAPSKDIQGVIPATKTLSIALATFNGARYLREQLDSFRRQTQPPDELVVSDDGSTDDTLAILRECARTAPFPVRILADQPRLGFADNFLRAAAACTGDLIAFSDQDDVWLDDKLEVSARRIREDGSLLSMHTLLLIDGEGNVLGLHPQGVRASRVLDPLSFEPERAGWGNSLLFSRRLLELAPRQSRPRDPDGLPSMKHDTYVYLLAASLGRVSHIATPHVLYRQHQHNAVGAPRGRSLRDRIEGALTVPLDRHRARLEYYEDAARMFGQIADAADPAFGVRARAAAKRYAARAALFRRRLDVYTAPQLAARISGLVSLIARGDGEDDVALKAKVLSRAKDFALGLCGLGLSCR